MRMGEKNKPFYAFNVTLIARVIFFFSTEAIMRSRHKFVLRPCFVYIDSGYHPAAVTFFLWDTKHIFLKYRKRNTSRTALSTFLDMQTLTESQDWLVLEQEKEYHYVSTLSESWTDVGFEPTLDSSSMI